MNYKIFGLLMMLCSVSLIAATVAEQQPMTGEQLMNLVKVQKVKIGKETAKILTDNNGRTLYIFTDDKPNESTCYEKCQALWPPAFVVKMPKSNVVSDIPTSLAKQLQDKKLGLGVTTRRKGWKQLTYGGRPLYYYRPDKNPGDTTGEGVHNKWYTIRFVY